MSSTVDANGLMANFPDSLSYCFGIIQLEINVTEEDF